MYHDKNNLFIGRRADGSVRILKFESNPEEWPQADGEYPDAALDATIDPFAWASVVSSVSAGGENHERYHKALAFHNERAS
jgi:hypothetical protein